MPVAKDPTDRVVAEILDGRHDSRFKEIAEAVQARINTGATRIVWRITLDGDIWDGRTVTAGEVRFVEQITGVSWRDQDPRGSMDQLVAFVVAHHRANGDDNETAVRKAEAITQEQALEMVDDYELVNPPKASPGSTTT